MSGLNNSSSSYRSDVGIGALVGGGLFATALGCGVIALGPLAIPIGIGAVLAGAILFPTTIKPAITKVASHENTPSLNVQHRFGEAAFSKNSWELLLKGSQDQKTKYCGR